MRRHVAACCGAACLSLELSQGGTLAAGPALPAAVPAPPPLACLAPQRSPAAPCRPRSPSRPPRPPGCRPAGSRWPAARSPRSSAPSAWLRQRLAASPASAMWQRTPRAPSSPWRPPSPSSSWWTRARRCGGAGGAPQQQGQPPPPLGAVRCRRRRHPTQSAPGQGRFARWAPGTMPPSVYCHCYTPQLLCVPSCRLPQLDALPPARSQADWIALIASADFFFNDSQNESMAENLRERVRYMAEKASRLAARLAVLLFSKLRAWALAAARTPPLPHPPPSNPCCDAPPHCCPPAWHPLSPPLAGRGCGNAVCVRARLAGEAVPC